MIDNAIEVIRALSKRQVTPLRAVNLEELIHSLVDKFDESSSIKISFAYNVNGRNIDDELKINIYRIIQEQINNVIKHAEASQINISVSDRSGNLHVTVGDNGKGFDKNQKRKGIGVSNMINRVESFNGDFTIESSPGMGCKLDIKIPL